MCKDMYVCVMESNLVTYINWSLAIGMTQMDLEHVVLCEISQVEKDKYHLISLMCNIRKRHKHTEQHKHRLIVMKRRLRVPPISKGARQKG